MSLSSLGKKFFGVSPALVLLVGCQTMKPYVPPAKLVKVHSVTVEARDFYGRTDVFADIRGALSSNAAQLLDVKQSRDKGNLLLLTVREQTPRDAIATNQVANPPFQTRVPLEVLGLEPGQQYVVSANGVKTLFTLPLPEEETPGSPES